MYSLIKEIVFHLNLKVTVLVYMVLKDHALKKGIISLFSTVDVSLHIDRIYNYWMFSIWLWTSVRQKG